MIAGTQFGRYEIRQKVGEGGMGEVYAAHDLELDRTVAIKLLPGEFKHDEDRKARFKKEARVVSSLNHPNVITIYEIGENEFGSFLATELVHGRTLREILKTETLGLARSLRIAEQAANALVAAHNERIVHRDIKPENIMVRHDSIVKVLDFGLAKPTGESLDAGEDNKTLPGTVMGSARYMSPEQARGLKVDERTDIWSLGVVLYEMLTGKVPFDGETTADTIASVIYHDPAPLEDAVPGLPPEIYRIVRRALQKDREERYQHSKDFALDIKNLMFEVERANSGGRTVDSDVDTRFRENPTMMIHRTDSANHPTNRTGVVSSRSFGSIVGESGSPKRKVFAAAAAVLVLGVIGLGLFGSRPEWFDWASSFIASSELGAEAFVRPQLTRLNTDGRVNSPAISPDGKYVAYVAGELGGRSIVVRQISTDSIVTVVPPTNLNLHSVTFSPDGEHVYYCQTRSDFAVNTLYSVPTLGGTPKRLIEDVDSTVTFSPDGKRFAFMRHVSPTNEDLYFIADTATLQADEVLRSKQTDYDFLSARPAWSPDGERILVAGGKRESGFVSRMAIGEVNVAEKKLRVLNDDKFFMVGGFKWFADGSGFLLTARESQNGPIQIWKASYPGLDIVPVTNDFNDYVEIGLADDGRTIVSLKADTVSSLWRVSANGQQRHQITTESRNVEGANGLISTSGGSIIYTRNDGKEADIWTSDADGQNARILLDEKGWALFPVLTPDGKYIVYNLQKDRSSRIWRMNADGTNAVQLTEENPDHADFNPQVSPDGKWIIFQRAQMREGNDVLMRISLGGGAAEVFHSDNDWSVFGPRLSPDGKRIAYMAYNRHTWEKKLRVASLDGDRFGTVERDLDNTLVNHFFWAPDSRSLTAISSRGGSQNLWRLPIDGSEPTPITDFKTGRILNFAWTAGGREMLVVRGNTNNDLIVIRDADRTTGRDSASLRSGSRRTAS